jgi:aspartyl aminopeptidase
LDLLAAELGVDVDDIADFEINLFDVQKSSLGGVRSEFLHSARLDNLASCFLALEGLLAHVEGGELEHDSDIPLVVMFDHEEIGSNSATGAGSPIIGDAVRRISTALYDNDKDSTGTVKEDWLASCINKSFVLSSDQAHAIHPNYASKHEKQHAPKMNGGMVIKTNVNQRYATNGITGFIIREIARRAELPPVQEFVVRQDCGCGSTIGPLISATTGIRAIDMGCPQLSMHSIRETMGVADCKYSATDAIDLISKLSH